MIRAAFRSTFKHAARVGGEVFIMQKNISNIAGLSVVSFLLAYNVVVHQKDNSRLQSSAVLLESASSPLPPTTATTNSAMTDSLMDFEEIFSKYFNDIRFYLSQKLCSNLTIRGETVEREILEETTDYFDLNKERHRIAAQFPSLAAHVLFNKTEDGTSAPSFLSPHAFPINSNEPIPIENDIFVGHVMLILRPLHPEDDPDYQTRIQSLLQKQETATFSFQIQGRFKKPVRKDQVFVGAEITQKMNLGVLTKKVSDLFLRLLSAKIGGMTYSFGSEIESPNIAFPLYSAMSTVIVSRAPNSPDSGGDCLAVPPIGTPFIEPKESRERRTKYKHGFTDKSGEDLYWNTADTYSMSYTAASIDLSAWKVLLPFEVQLARFWGQSALRLVIFEYELEEIGGKAHSALQNTNRNYVFNLQLEQLGNRVLNTSSVPAGIESQHKRGTSQRPSVLSTSTKQ